MNERRRLPKEDIKLFNELKDDLSLEFLYRTYREYGIEVVLKAGEIYEIMA